VILDTNEYFSIHFSAPTQFTYTLIGRILLNASSNGFQILTFGFLLIANSFYIIYFKKHFKKKTKILKIADSASKIGKNALSTATGSNEQVRARTGSIDLNERKIKKIARSNYKATIMVFCMCVLATIERTFLIASTIYFYYRSDVSATPFFLAANLSILLKNLANFFLYYLFNKNFRKELKSSLCVRYRSQNNNATSTN
jgi:hypothetical protein